MAVSLLAQWQTWLTHMGLATVLRVLFLGLASAILLASLLVKESSPAVFVYGARKSGSSSTEQSTRKLPAVVLSVLDWTSSLQVPHGWFASFYVVSTCMSLFWGQQMSSNKDHIFVKILASDFSYKTSMSLDQVILIWVMMLVHGLRRLYESVSFSKPSKSTMWVGHWVLGLVFYTAVNMAVWVEGIPILRTERPSVKDFTMKAPSVRTCFGLPIFLIASGVQHDCHAYLASLKKYSLPMHPAFQLIVCPHYFAECLVYLSFSIVAAPDGHVLNTTLLCTLIFVFANLAITARDTRKWYAQKFGLDSVRSRWIMIPFIW